jgi:hypothetical protein
MKRRTKGRGYKRRRVNRRRETVGRGEIIIEKNKEKNIKDTTKEWDNDEENDKSSS